MQISDVRKRILQTIDRAKQQVAERRARNDEATRAFGPFLDVDVGNEGNEVTLAFMDADGMQVQTQHYAFLVDGDQFDVVLQRVRDAGVTHFADPNHRVPSTINMRAGGRGFYFSDPGGHNLEVLTRPYTGAA
jgi:catechol 2,3-dioxygenase-like lactoylglutathione lyase family enzyme